MLRHIDPEIVLENISLANAQPLICFFQIKFQGVVRTACIGSEFFVPGMQGRMGDAGQCFSKIGEGLNSINFTGTQQGIYDGCLLGCFMRA